MSSECITPLSQSSRSAGISNVVLYTVSPVLMLFLSEFTIERVSPAIVQSSRGDFVHNLFMCQLVLRALLVTLALHIIRYERPGPLAVTICLSNLTILQLWLLENTSWDEVLTYRLAPLTVCIGVLVGAFIIDILLSGFVKDIALVATSAGALLLSHFVTRWNSLMVVVTPLSPYQWMLILAFYLGILLYLSVLVRLRAGRRFLTYDPIAT
jgi:hypothetical protein